MKKSLFLAAAAICGSVMSANAADNYTLDAVEKAAWANLSTTDLASNNYVGEWGKLTLVGNQLCSSKGDPIQLRGWSTFSINYQEVTPCLTEAGFDAMKTWGANVVRLAIYPTNSQGSWSLATDKTIEKYIKWANDRHMYCLVDWHVLEGDGDSGDPSKYASQAKEMFADICAWVTSQKYNNCLYEICNECSGVTWSAIKSYADGVLPTIESNDPGAVVIVGTPQWDQNIGEAVTSPISKTKYNLNLMYAFHFYACSHMYLVGNMQSAAASLPVFISEWGSVAFDGAGGFCGDNSSTFLSYLKPAGNNGGQLISWCYWAWGQKSETSNCLQNCGSSFSSSNLTTSGTYIVGVLTGSTTIQDPPAPEYWEIQDIPYMSTLDYGVINVGYFDKGGQNVSYFDTNSSKYKDPENKCEDKESCFNTDGIEYTYPNAGAYYSCNGDLTKYEKMFRSTEDVDVTNTCAGLGANWGDPGDGLVTQAADLHNISKAEAGEWMIYTINVTKPGYYTVKCMTNNNTSNLGTIGMAIAKGTKTGQTGNIIRSWSAHESQKDVQSDPWQSFALNPTPQCGQLYEGGQDPNGATKGDKSADWTCWGWTDCGKTADDQEDLTVLFKYAGEQKLQITISPDVTVSTGDFSNFAFTLKSETIPDWEFTSVENEEAELNNVSIFPNPTTGDFTVKVNGAANVSIFSATGAKVYNQDVEGDVTVKNNFAPGIYTVRVATAAGVKSLKLVVK